MYCGNCGQENSNGENFCKNCGTNLTDSVDNGVSYGQTNVPTKKYTVAGAIGRACAWFFGGMGAFVVLTIIKTVIELVVFQGEETSSRGLLHYFFNWMVIVLPFISSFVIAPIVLTVGLIRSEKK